MTFQSQYLAERFGFLVELPHTGLHQTAALQQQILSSGIGGMGRSDVDRSVRAQCTRRCELIGLSVRVHQLRKQRHVVVQRQVAEGAEAQSPDRIDGVEIADRKSTRLNSSN